MRLLAYILLFSLGNMVLQEKLCAQEEESAALSMQEYSDEFQENFFEALKQKGIENYDKAINNLLECKRLEPDNAVVDYELARTYLEDNQPMPALEYGITAINADPANIWYLEILISAALQQGKSLDLLKARIPYGNTLLRENLARVFYRRNDYQAALRVLKDLSDSGFSRQMESKIRGSGKTVEPAGEEVEKQEANPMQEYQGELQELLESGDFVALDRRSEEALENFPSFPYFYFVRGMVLLQNNQYREASGILEEGLNYLLDDRELEIKFYQALARAYEAQGNSSKANMYLNKIKSGS